MSDGPLAVEGFVLQKGTKRRILLANLTDKEQKTRIENVVTGKPFRVRSLDETNAEAAMTSPESFRQHWQEATATGAKGIEVRMRPFAVVAIEQELPASG